mmetsp:Transcript_18220/g.25887  ORF Transcript_18220/g.25887 Transcript_18220/m.25887 type:complete len:289 (-) Transcript_18220:489-1355(-)|eukprot:CAMPEP_0201696588 /NCGR_PEP_ID=MMETSP0578-20130828/8204_1 /ASSEMBLY_ACC=CAM_ASM_000663 /TAXON_ID=267565 /ORGANISM="Skeletonema grethea, Strain CCMP 1804" /LENGTH=288 /DNA_ID=CAMNT_0048182597 /DNA_START=73 /DNA_END=939 /DNA_ORIENTATION=-
MRFNSIAIIQVAAVAVAQFQSSSAFVAPAPHHINRNELRAETISAETISAETTSTDTTANPSTAKRVSKSPIFEYLKFDGAPTFDVIEKTKAYVESQQLGENGADKELYDKDYVLRGPVIGPINREDLFGSQNGLGLRDAFPNVEIDSFGYTVDPENPYRCLYFQRWRAVHENDLDAYGDIYPATGTEAEMPVSVFSVVWTPEEKVIYEQVGAVVDRLEGNTQGKAAVFGLLHHAGLKLNANPGDGVFAFIQRLAHVIGGRGRSWSRKNDVPGWWVSKSKGADASDQW